jgi:hypothetical protein
MLRRPRRWFPRRRYSTSEARHIRALVQEKATWWPCVSVSNDNITSRRRVCRKKCLGGGACELREKPLHEIVPLDRVRSCFERLLSCARSPRSRFDLCAVARLGVWEYCIVGLRTEYRGSCDRLTVGSKQADGRLYLRPKTVARRLIRRRGHRFDIGFRE